jgi:hypothetical protein
MKLTFVKDAPVQRPIIAGNHAVFATVVGTTLVLDRPGDANENQIKQIRNASRGCRDAHDLARENLFHHCQGT